ncbi:MAG: hypothetical protein HKN26_04885, partial [Acidimicrobiales bacterium]|nr:hypothetical protein [Acidimicrobiales bacterium]
GDARPDTGADAAPPAAPVEPAADGSGDADPAPAETEVPPEATAAPAAPAEPDGAPVALSFDDGRSWSLDGSCMYNPDASGPASSTWWADGVSEDGAELNAIEAFPIDPDKTEPVLIASFVDDADQLYTGKGAEVTADGSTMTVTMELFEGLANAEDPADVTATITCSV